jgi:glycerol kinase
MIQKKYGLHRLVATSYCKVGISGKEIAAMELLIKETTIIWDRETSEPVYNAIVWQDRRTAKYCDELKAQGHADMIKKKTGLVLDAFSGTSKMDSRQCTRCTRKAERNFVLELLTLG